MSRETALWCEAKGLNDERETLLDQALKLDPRHATAHALRGHVEQHGDWLSPEEVAARVRADEKLTGLLAEYNARRAQLDREVEMESRLSETLENRQELPQDRDRLARLDADLTMEHIRLGLWCEQKGLKAEAIANFTSAVHYNPHDEMTWRHLGYKRHNGQWMNPQQIAAATAEEKAQRRADHHWHPLLLKWYPLLSDPTRKEEAERFFATVTDPRAVPSIVREFAVKATPKQELAVRLLGQIDSPPATKELGAFAVYGAADQIRHDAATALAGREPRDFGETLVNLIHAPWAYEAEPPSGPGTEGRLVVDSPRFHMTRTYSEPLPFKISSSFRGYVGYGPDGLPCIISASALRSAGHSSNPILAYEREIEALRRGEEEVTNMIATARLEGVVARQRMLADVRDIEANNARSIELNHRVASTLAIALDAPTTLSEDDEDGWRTWYYDRVGYRYTPPPKVTLSTNATPGFYTPHFSDCFAAGTPVMTMTGSRPIESLHVGERVLSQEVKTGALSYQPVLRVHHDPPDGTLKVSLENGDSVVTSRFHRFWVAGSGWRMARDLEAGQAVRTLHGPSRITSVETDRVQPVYNLDVAESRTYFVGSSSMLVHDNTPPDAHADGPFFDTIPSLAAASR